MARAKVVRRRLADGTVKEYRYKPKGAKVKTVGDVLKEFERSASYRQFKPNTKEVYGRCGRYIHQYYDTPITDIKRRHLKSYLDTYYDQPVKANQIVQFFVTLLSFAVEQEYIEFNPGLRIRKLRGGEYARWTDAQLDFALTAMPEHYRRAIILALYTGQRQGDCCRMLWSDYDGSAIQVAQEKTGAKVWIPVHPTLKTELDAWRKSATAATILTNMSGHPYTQRTLSSRFGKYVRRLPELSGVVFHGLRKTAAAKLAEAGCSPAEIAAITGHKTLKMIMHYTKEADQRRQATAAIVKLADFARGKRSENEA